MVFEKKKIQIETLSEYLHEVRSHSGLSLAEAAKKTGINSRFLQALESGNFAALPAEVYVRGFLKQLGMLYGIESEILIRQYKKEEEILQRLKHNQAYAGRLPRKIFNRIVITPKFLAFILGGLFVLLAVGYLIGQVVSINHPPALNVLEPKDQQVITGSAVQVDGKTDSSARVTVNGENVFVDKNGNFKTTVGIAPGPRQLIITAANSFGKSVSQTLSVIGQDQFKSQQAKLQLKLSFTGPVVLSYSVDNQSSQTLNFQAGDTQQLMGNQQIILSVSDAGATRVVFNGSSLGVLGRPGEKLKNIPFSAESGSINMGSQ